MRDFRRDLAESMDLAGDQRTVEILRSYFGRPKDFSVDWSPRSVPYGFDCFVRAWDESWKIEEKRRRRDFGDELLEYVSNDRTQTLGWALKCDGVDFVLIVYPTRWTIWPGKELCEVTRARLKIWIAEYGIRSSPNKGYTTLNVPVPTQVLSLALSECGAPRCVHCGRNVGRFGVTCNCGRKSCCAIGDWICECCAGEIS